MTRAYIIANGVLLAAPEPIEPDDGRDAPFPSCIVIFRARTA